MKKVLVVDDTKNIRVLLAKCLEMQGYAVATAGDGREALERISKQDFDLIFLDIKLPLMSGTEVLARMREMGRQTPVIIITAYATVKNAVECTRMGAVAYLQKPFTIHKIQSVLAELKESGCSPAIETKRKAEGLIASKQHAEAITLLKPMLAETPLDGEIYLLLSKACAGLGNGDEAEKYRRVYDSLHENA